VSPAAAASPFPDGKDNPHVLAGRPLRRGAGRLDGSRFNDDIWDLTPAILQGHQDSLMLNFRAVPAPFRPAAKELFYILLTATDLPPGERKRSIASIRGYFSGLRDFFGWADERGSQVLSSLRPDDLEAYHERVLRQRKSVTVQRRYRGAVRMLWTYAPKLASGGLPFDPGQVPGWAAGPARPRGENKTPRIPEQVLAPLLTWALSWTEDIANDVIAAVSEWLPLHANTALNRRRRETAATRNVAARLEKLLSRYRAEQRPLPGGKNGQPMHAHLAPDLRNALGSWELNPCLRGDAVGDRAVVAGDGGRGVVNLVDDHGEGAGDAGLTWGFEDDGDRGGGEGDGSG
jgi:Phage integrase, N-terminal SAM-like domain